ncbi:MAG: MlaD family protein [Planctomycetota bacterium]
MREQYKSSKLSFRIGLIIIIGTLVTIALLLGFGEGIFVNTYKIKVLFEHAGGLKKDTPVYMAGVAIGYVDSLTPPTAQTPYVQVIINIYKNIDIRSDAILTIESLGLIGEKYLELSIGSKDAPILPKDGSAQIMGRGVGGLQKVALTVTETAEEFKKALKEIGSFISSKQFKKSVMKSFKTFTKFNAKGTALFKELQNKIKSLQIENINNASQELVVSLKKTQHTLDSFNEFINESKRVVGELKNVQEVINTLKSISDKTNTLLTKIVQGEGTIGELINSKDFYFSIKNTIGKFDTTLTTISDKLQGAISSFQGAISSFTDNINEMKGVVRDIKSGRGTIGKLTYDEEVYNKILNTLEQIKNSFESIKKTSGEAEELISEIKECPDIMVWGREKASCKNKYKSNVKQPPVRRRDN